MKDGSAIVRSISGIEVSQRTEDGYINATQLLKAHEIATGEKKYLKDWLRTDRAKAYLEEVSKRWEIPPFDLTKTKKPDRITDRASLCCDKYYN